MHMHVCAHNSTCTNKALKSPRVCVTSAMTHLIGVDKNKEVINTDSQHKERHHFQYDESVHDTNVAEQPYGGEHCHQHHQHTNETNGDLYVNLQVGKSVG